MTIAEDLWLRGQAAQSNFLHIISYNTAFAGTAALQGVHLGLTAPRSFWAAMARASGVAEQGAEAPGAALPDQAPKTKAKAKPKKTAAAKPKPAPVAEVVALAPAAPVAEVPAPPPVEEVAAALADAGPSPHLLDEPRGGKPDDLTVLAGVGAKLAASLNEFGIYHFDQIATLDDEGIGWLDQQQKGFRMICARYDLVGQAKAMS